MMKSILALFTLAAVASASLSGITVDSSAFAIVSVNPDTGASSATSTTITTRPAGQLAFSATVLDSSDQFWSLQTDSANQAYLVSQDLSLNGRREECWISSDAAGVRPIQLFNDKEDGSVIATAVASNAFGIYRFSINPNNRICTSVLLGTISGTASIAPLASAQRGSKIYLVTEPTATPFASGVGPIIASYEVSGNAATLIKSTSTSAGLFFTSIAAITDTSIVAQGFDTAQTSVSYGTWTYDLETGSASTNVRLPVSNSEQISTASTYVAQSSSLYTLKTVQTSGVTTSSNVATFSFASGTTTTSESTRSTATSNKIFKLFDLDNSMIENIDAASSLVNTVVLTGDNIYASSASTSVSRCRFTVGSATTSSTATAIGSSTADGVSCTFSGVGVTAGNVLKVEFAADGVNYINAPSFVYGATSATSAKFNAKKYTLDNAKLRSTNQEPISVELFDASGNKILYSSAITGSIAPESATSSFRSFSGNSASSTNGRISFPNFSVDVFTTTAANSIADLKLVFTSGTASASADAAVRVQKTTRSATAALNLASSAFSYSLVNPSSSSAPTTTIGTRTFTSTNTLAYGLSTFDHVNSILNTVELSSAGVPLIVGATISGASNTAAGSCMIPTTTNVMDTPIHIAFETSSNGITTFLAVVDIAAKTGAGFKIVRYTRIASSTETTTCTAVTVAELPQMEVAYGHLSFLTGGRLAVISRDSVFSTAGPDALLSVYSIGDETTAGRWTIRNKNLPFTAIGVSQSGENELAISGRSGSTDGVWRIDIARDNSAILAPVTLRETFASASQQSYFLSSGNSASLGPVTRLSGSVTAASAQQLDAVVLNGGDASASITRAPSSTVVSSSGFVSLFNINDPTITTIANSAANEVTVTASNIVNTAALTCSFYAVGTTSVTVAASNPSASGVFPADGNTYSCGTIPAVLTSGSNRAIFVALSNDGTNFGASACVAIGTGQCPTIAGIAATPSNLPSNTGSTTIPISRQLVFFFTGKAQADCAASVALVNAFFTKANVKFTTVTEADCAFNANYIPTAVTTSAVRMLQGSSGIVINSVLETAADKNAAVTAFNADPIPGATVNDANPAAAASDDDDGLTDGEIAGIVIGSVAGVVLIGALIAFALKGSSKKAPAAAASPAATYSTRDATFTDATTASGSYDSTGASGSYDSTSGSYDSDSGSYDSEDYSDYSGSSYV